jgi:hypothetical protein
MLSSVRDIKLYYISDAEVKIYAKLQGIITRADPHGKIIFFRLFDGTDTIQLIADRGDFSEEDWLIIRSIKKSNRISVDASVGISSNGTISLFLKTIPIQTTEVNLDKLQEVNTEPGTISSQIFLARLRTQATNFFVDQDFIEIEPNFVSASWESTGLEALKVDYPGFGGPAYLVPSPSPQILRALILTGKQRIFSISRCFTTSFRDSASSYQSLILCAKEIGVSLDRMINLSIEAIRKILGDVSTRPEGTIFLNSQWPIVELSWPPKATNLLLTSPIIHVFKNFDSDLILSKRNILLFRAIWPPDFVLAEGSVEFLGENVSIGSLTLHIERMLFLIKADSTIRRIWHEGLRNKEIL